MLNFTGYVHKQFGSFEIACQLFDQLTLPYVHGKGYLTPRFPLMARTNRQIFMACIHLAYMENEKVYLSDRDITQQCADAHFSVAQLNALCQEALIECSFSPNSPTIESFVAKLLKIQTLDFSRACWSLNADEKSDGASIYLENSKIYSSMLLDFSKVAIVAYRTRHHRPIPNSAVAALAVCLVNSFASILVKCLQDKKYKDLADYCDTKFSGSDFEKVLSLLDLKNIGCPFKVLAKNVNIKLRDYLKEVNLKAFCQEDQLMAHLDSLWGALGFLLKIETLSKEEFNQRLDRMDFIHGQRWLVSTSDEVRVLSLDFLD